MLMLSVGLTAFAVPLSAQTAFSPLATPEAVACALRLATDESAPADWFSGHRMFRSASCSDGVTPCC